MNHSWEVDNKMVSRDKVKSNFGPYNTLGFVLKGFWKAMHELGTAI